MVARPPASLVTAIHTKRILVTVGSGGVGKTTTAAALGLLAARLRRRTLVMTIDPARRLATSLGLESLDGEARPVPAEKTSPAGIAPDTLHAMMLEPKQAFDEMVRRYAPQGDAARRLLESRIYQQLSARLAGSQEYAAMEKLHAMRNGDQFELIVLDTPPTANALDFLDAPRKMVDAVESPAVHLFVSAYQKAGKLSLNLLGFGAAYVVRRLARFTGGQFLDEIAAFLSELSVLLGGMHERAAQVLELLQREEVGFVIVTAPDPRAIDEAIGLHERLIEGGLALSGFIINKVHPLRPVDLPAAEVARRIEVATGSGGEPAVALAERLLLDHGRMQVLARADAAEIERLRARCGEAHAYLPVPLFNEDVHDVRGLVKLGDHLL
jgi:anion-transporting  ArsA/GET3 family ATPase